MLRCAVCDREHLVKLLPVIFLDGGQIGPVHGNRVPRASGNLQLLHQASWAVVPGFSLLARHTRAAISAHQLAEVINMIPAPKKAHSPIDAPVSCRKRVVVHGDNLFRIRLGYDDPVVFPQPLIVKNAGVVQDLGVRSEALLALQMVGRVLFTPSVAEWH